MLALRGPPAVGEVLRGQRHGDVVLAGVHLEGAFEEPLVVIADGRGIVQRTRVVVRVGQGLWGRSIRERGLSTDKGADFTRW